MSFELICGRNPRTNNQLLTSARFVLISPRQGEAFCRVRHRITMVEPTSFTREADIAG